MGISVCRDHIGKSASTYQIVPVVHSMHCMAIRSVSSVPVRQKSDRKLFSIGFEANITDGIVSSQVSTSLVAEAFGGRSNQCTETSIVVVRLLGNN